MDNLEPSSKTPWGILIAALALAISLISGATAGYVANRTDMATLAGKIGEHELRLNAMDRDAAEFRKDQMDFRIEMRAAVAHAVDLLTDVRIRLGAKATHG